MGTGVGSRLRALADYDVLALTALIWFLAKFLRYAFPPLFPAFRDALGVSSAVLGVAFTAMLTVYAAMQFPSGALADRVGARRVIVAGAVVTGLGALVLAVPVPDALALGVLGGGMLLVGLGTGVHKTVAVRLLSRLYPGRTGRALGVLDTLGAFGGVAAPAAVVAVTGATVAGVALPWLDWHALFLAGAVAAGGLALLFARSAPDPGAADLGGAATDGSDDADTAAGDDTSDHAETDGVDDTGGALRRYAALFREPAFAFFVLATVCFSFAYNGAVAFLPLYLTDAAGLPETTASLLYSGLFVVSLVQLGTGDLSDRVGQLPVIAATLALATGGLLALLSVSGVVAVAGAVVAFGLGSHGFRPVRGAYLAAVLPESAAGGGLGVVRTLLMSAGALAPAVVGGVADATGFGAAFGVLAVALVASLALTGVVAVVDGS
ncbi:MFS transporter [Halobaculum magnesiiphilum]|uniref:MFS transporter n=1 Tax=Halobaculum magnesiiphilum TaxID=1017351 RepID=A0A8T8W9G6_9EURY|nr:MFS transporter [Halobaculum magnesiiphilum]QZP36471.1 MFS transporter [Halobaculum magnesiiphilum]